MSFRINDDDTMTGRCRLCGHVDRRDSDSPRWDEWTFIDGGRRHDKIVCPDCTARHVEFDGEDFFIATNPHDKK